MAEKSEGMDRPGWFPFDMFQHPVPANKGEQGRPQTCYVPEIFESMIRAFARGWPKVRVARAHGLSVPTMDKVYFATREAKAARQAAIDIFELEIDSRLDQQSKAGNTGATKALAARVEKARLGDLPTAHAPTRRKGVKEERRAAAYDAGSEDSDWGPLIGPARLN